MKASETGRVLNEFRNQGIPVYNTALPLNLNAFGDFSSDVSKKWVLIHFLCQ